MGFLRKLGSFGNKVFGRGADQPKPSAVKKPVMRSQSSGPIGDQAKLEETFRREREKMLSAIENKFKDDLSPEEIRLVRTFGNLPQTVREFLLGKPTQVTSSNVDTVSYNWDGASLTISYKNGGVYQYFEISPPEAKSLIEAGSKGKWVWDHLRKRGTVYGFKKPYVLLSVSGYQPKWDRDSRWRQQHGGIPESGERPSGWSKRGPGGKTPARHDGGA